MVSYLSGFCHWTACFLGYTTILTVVGRFSKMANFIPLVKLPSEKKTAENLMAHVFRIHGFPIWFLTEGPSSHLTFGKPYAPCWVQ